MNAISRARPAKNSSGVITGTGLALKSAVFLVRMTSAPQATAAASWRASSKSLMPNPRAARASFRLVSATSTQARRSATNFPAFSPDFEWFLTR